MSSFDVRAWRVSTPDSRYAASLFNQDDGYIATNIASVVPTSMVQGQFKQWSFDTVRRQADYAKPGTEAPVGSLGGFYVNYSLEWHAFAHTVDEARADADLTVEEMRMAATRASAEQIKLNLENNVITKAFTSTNYGASNTTTLSAGDTWADAAGDPIEDVRAGLAAIVTSSGQASNMYGACNITTMNYLKQHPAIVDRIKYTSGDRASEQVIANVLGLDGIFVQKAVQNTANMGASDSLSHLIDDDFLVFHKARGPVGRDDMDYMKLFVGQDLYTKRIETPELGRNKPSYKVEVGMQYDWEFGGVVSSSDGDSICGYLILNVY